MQRASSVRQRRGGFTLIEMIVVIGIIVLLAGLLLQVIVKVREVGPRAETKHEIGQIAVAIENFKATYNVKYLPTAFVLTNDYSNPPNPQWAEAYRDSRDFYSKVWPKGFLPVPPATGPGQPNIPPGTLVPMDGNQVLVFFLGGIPPGDQKSPARFQGNRTGFLDSPTNPFNVFNGVAYEPAIKPATGERDTSRAKGPFFDFKLNRIDIFGHYHDPYWSPTDDPNDPNINRSIYYYFSSKNGNDYDYFGRYMPVMNPNNQLGAYTPRGGYGGMDPFISPDNKFMNPYGFQIISAGRDQLPWPGGFYAATNQRVLYTPGMHPYSPGAPGGDDTANFGGPMLGSE